LMGVLILKKLEIKKIKIKIKNKENINREV
jgi:hypothetical protein